MFKLDAPPHYNVNAFMLYSGLMETCLNLEETLNTLQSECIHVTFRCNLAENENI